MNLFNGLSPANPPSGTMLYSCQLNAEGTSFIETFGVKNFHVGSISYSGSNYRPGSIISFRWPYFRTFVLNPHLTAEEINQIAQLSLDLFRAYSFMDFTTENLRLIDKLTGSLGNSGVSLAMLSGASSIASLVENSLSQIGVLASQLKASELQQERQRQNLIRELLALNVIMVERPFILSLPLDLMELDEAA